MKKHDFEELVYIPALLLRTATKAADERSLAIITKYDKLDL
jgi:hypothetical protein